MSTARASFPAGRALRSVALMAVAVVATSAGVFTSSVFAEEVTSITSSETPSEGVVFTADSQLSDLLEALTSSVEEEEEEEEYDDETEYVDDEEAAQDPVRRLRSLAIKKKKVVNPATQPGASNLRTFSVTPSEYTCDMLSWAGPTLWKTCLDDVTGLPSRLRTIDVPYNYAKDTPEVGCGQKCIAFNLENNETACLGASVIGRGKCRLAVCSAGTSLSPNPSLVSRKSAWPSKSMKPRAFSFPPECNVPEPTPAPPSAPIPFCATDSSILNRMPTLIHKFAPVVVNKNKCEMTELRSPFGARYFTQNGYACSLETCVRWCAYDALCKYAGYSPVLKQCYKSTGTQVTDDPSRVNKWAYEDWTIMALKPEEGGDVMVPYYGGKCALLVSGSCKGECGLNKGRMGYNDEKIGGSANQFCGRVSCKAVPYSP